MQKEQNALQKRLKIFHSICNQVLDKYKVITLLKGSCTYGIPHSKSDIDIEINCTSYDQFKTIVKEFGGEIISPIIFHDSDGDSYKSTIGSFVIDDVEVNLIYDEHPKVFEMVRLITEHLNSLSLKQKYIIRLVSSGWKYDTPDSVDIFLNIYEEIKHKFDAEKIEGTENGQLIDSNDADYIKKSIQRLYFKRMKRNIK